MSRRPASLLLTVVLAGGAATLAVQPAYADACLSLDNDGVCFPSQSTTVVPSESVGGGPVVVPSESVGGDVTGGPIYVNSPDSVCYLLGCIQRGQTLATVPDVSVPVVVTPTETAPVPVVTTPAVTLPFDPSQPYIEPQGCIEFAPFICD